jgi:hypothetical protein
MTTSTFYPSLDGDIGSQDPTYATARSGAGLSANTTDPGDVAFRPTVGQTFDTSYRCYEAFYRFDTSSIPDDDVVDSATLSIYGLLDQSTTDFIIQARAFDFGDTLTTADWRSGNPAGAGSLDEYTLVATFDTAAGWSTSGYNNFTSEAAFAAAISKTGFTSIILGSSRHLAGTTPTGSERVLGYYAEKGGDFRPKLIVEHFAAGSLPPVGSLLLYGVGR